MTVFRPLALAALLVTLSFPALAQGTSVAFGTITQNTDAPVEVSADQLAVDQESGKAVFSGNVLVGQGDMRLTAARVEVIYKTQETGIEKLQATGGVTLVSGPDAAEARQADYDIDLGVIIMTGDVLLTQGRSALTSDRMSVNLKDGTAKMIGRVKTVLQPNAKN